MKAPRRRSMHSSYAARAWRLASIGCIALTAVFSGESRGQDSASSLNAKLPSPAEPVVRLLEGADSHHLSRVDALIAGKQFDEAVETLSRLADRPGTALIKLPTPASPPELGFTRYKPAHEFIQEKFSVIAQLAPESFNTYRRQVDPAAERLLEQAIQNGDETVLRQVARDYFLSSAGDEATLRLGDIAFERGELTTARRLWQRLDRRLRFPPAKDSLPQLEFASHRPLWLPFRGVDVKSAWPVVSKLFAEPTAGAADLQPAELVYSQTNLPLPEIRARLTMLAILEGNEERADIEIAILRELAGDARGEMGGRQVNLVQFLESFKESHRTSSPKPIANWPTWNGGPSPRSDVLPETLEAPLWSVPLPRRLNRYEVLTHNRLRVAEDPDATLPYFPLILNDRAYIQTGARRDQVSGYDLHTGERLFPFSEPTNDASVESTRAVLGVQRFPLSTAGDNLFVRVGRPLSIAPGVQDQLAMPAKLESLDLNAEGKLRWSMTLDGPSWSGNWTLAGPPVTDGERLYIAAVRRGALRLETHVAALDPLDGRVLWRQFICAGEPAFSDTLSHMVHNLLTYDQGIVYCNTNHGAVAALDGREGSILWITSYPRSPLAGTDPDRNDLHFYRDLNPCLVFQDLVIVAPSDCRRIFALDATSGILIWSTPDDLAADGVHLLGVGANNVIVSGECLYWLDAFTGELVSQFPRPFLAAPGFARPSPRGYGRGMLAGDYVYWPTHDSILVFEQRVVPPAESDVRADPQERISSPGATRPRATEIPLAPHGATGGNLALAQGVLLIAGTDRLFAFDAEQSQNATSRRSRSGEEAQ